MNFITRLCPIPCTLNQQRFLGAKEWTLERKEGHTASKIALAQAYREFHLLHNPTLKDGIQASMTPANLNWFEQHHPQLEEQNYYVLKQQNDILCSRSHTRDLAAGAIAAQGLGLLSIGIDIESIKRKIKPDVEKFFLSQNEPELLGPPHLAIWVVKEAAFKAVSSYLIEQSGQPEPSLTLKSIHLKRLAPGEGEFHWRDQYHGFFKLSILSPTDLGDYLLAEASLTQAP